MMALVVWFLAAFGAAFVLGYSRISLGFRNWVGGWVDSSTTNDLATGQVHGHITTHKPAVPVLGPWLAALLECPGCLGWWLGLAAGASGILTWAGMPGWISALVFAFATSGCNLLLAKWVGLT